MTDRRATVIGSGPNGLVAAVVLARAGWSVRVLEAQEGAGGGARTDEITLPGFRHDLGSAVHPGVLTSPVLRAFGIRERVPWVIPDVSYAHPLDDGRAVLAWRDIDRTADALGVDGARWRRLLEPLASRMGEVVSFTGSSMLRFPSDVATAARYGIRSLALGGSLGWPSLTTHDAQALLAGVVAHANTRMPSVAAAAAGLLLAAEGHADGWGYPIGGAQTIANALAADLRAHGGEIETGVRVRSLAGADWGDAVVLAGSPRLALTLPDVPPAWGRAIHRFRYGPGAAKVDFALDGPVPWAAPGVSLAPTVHLGGTRAEIVAGESAVARGGVHPRPYVLVVQPSILDSTRAPDGAHTLWAYIHVPPDCGIDATDLITRQIERFAPGFRRRILAAHSTTGADIARMNPAAIGGDISGGAVTMRQLIARPVLSRTPWRTPMRGVYLASASVTPGPGVHGMGGWHAARTVVEDVTGVRVGLADLFG